MWVFLILGAAVLTWMFRGKSAKTPVPEAPRKKKQESDAEKQDSPSGAAQQSSRSEAELAKILNERQRLEAKGLNKEHFNVAFVGNSGVGKSMMIDALRGLPPTHANVRRTKQSTPYPVPQVISTNVHLLFSASSSSSFLPFFFLSSSFLPPFFVLLVDSVSCAVGHARRRGG
jgi:hypothetical protein